MTTAIALKPSPVEKFRQEVLPPERATDLYRSLASHIRPEVFERNLTNCLMANPDLLQFDPRLVYREVSKAAGLGLLLDPQLGEAYMIVAWNYKTKSKEPQLRVGYKGMCKLARQTGGVTTIRSHEVGSNDDVEVDFGFPKVLHVRPRNLFAERGEASGYIAIIEFKDGSFDFDAMSVDQCRAIRNRTDAWKAFQEGKIKTTPWATDEAEMSKKTALRRLLKRQDQSPELRRAIEIEDEAEFPEMREVRIAPAASKIPPPPMDEPLAIENNPSPPVGGNHGAAVDVGSLSSTAARPTQKAPPPPSPEDDGLDIPPLLDRRAKQEPLPTTDDPEIFRKKADDLMAACGTGEQLENVFNAQISPRLDSMFPPDADDILALYRKHERRLEP